MKLVDPLFDELKGTNMTEEQTENCKHAHTTCHFVNTMTWTETHFSSQFLIHFLQAIDKTQ